MKVIGHEEVKKRFADDLPSNIILLGMGGIGKNRLAIYLANQHAKPYDIMTVADDIVGIDVIREAGKFISKKPFGSRYKIVVVQTDGITDNAAQALLRMLEEPPARARFILTNSTGTLPLTILSRCLQVRLKPLTSFEVAEIMKMLGHNPEAAVVAGRFAKGSAANAINYLQSAEIRQSVLSVLQLIFNRKIEAVVTATRKWTDAEIAVMRSWFEDLLQRPYGNMAMFTEKELAGGSAINSGDLDKYMSLLRVPMKPSLKVLYLALRIMEGR